MTIQIKASIFDFSTILDRDACNKNKQKCKKKTSDVSGVFGINLEITY